MGYSEESNMSDRVAGEEKEKWDKKRENFWEIITEFFRTLKIQLLQIQDPHKS